MPDVRFPMTVLVSPDAAGQRLDQFLTTQIPDISRARVQQLLEEEMALVNGSAAKPSLRLKGGEQITILGDPQPAPLRAIAEDIPLDVVYEDDDLAVINKPAGMMVHAGAGATDDERNRGTLVNALLHRFGKLSEVGGELRPGIVHRLDKETSGLIVVAKNDVAHRKLAKQFSSRQVKKRYVTLVHGWPAKDSGTIDSEISRDAVRRTRMTTRRSGGRAAVTHYEVRERIESSVRKVCLAGRAHRDWPHSSDPRAHGINRASRGGRRTLWSAEGTASRSCSNQRIGEEDSGSPERRNVARRRAGGKRHFLASGEISCTLQSIEFTHPRTGEPLSFTASLPEELAQFLQELRG